MARPGPHTVRLTPFRRTRELRTRAKRYTPPAEPCPACGNKYRHTRGCPRAVDLILGK